MKWFFVLLLFANAVFLGWSYAHSVNRDDINSGFSVENPGGEHALKLLHELKNLPPPRNDGNWVPPHEEWEDTGDETEAPQQIATQGRVQDGGITEYEQDAAILVDEPWTVSETTCYTFGPMFSVEEADGLQQHLARYQLPHNRQTEEEVEVYYGVYLRPAKSVVALAELIDRMKSRGVDNYRLVSSGELRNNLSLGVYITREEVDARLSELKEKGFEPIVVPKHSDTAEWLNVRVEPHLVDAEFVQQLLQRDDRFVVECGETGLATE